MHKRAPQPALLYPKRRQEGVSRSGPQSSCSCSCMLSLLILAAARSTSSRMNVPEGLGLDLAVLVLAAHGGGFSPTRSIAAREVRGRAVREVSGCGAACHCGGACAYCASAWRHASASCLPTMSSVPSPHEVSGYTSDVDFALDIGLLQCA